MQEVTIRTPNGVMRVNPDCFFPSPRGKVRKLFRLMSAGTEPEQLRGMKDYLEDMRESAGIEKARAAEALKTMEKNLSDLDIRIAELKAAGEREKENLAAAKALIRRSDTVLKNVPDWIRDFEEICGEKTDG